MTTDQESRFSETVNQVNLPANFLACVGEISPDALLVLMAYFQLLSLQEQESQLALAHDLKISLPAGFHSEDERFDAALLELHNAQLLYSLTDPQNPQKTYLIAGTPQGTSIYRQLCKTPGRFAEYGLAKILADTSQPNLFKLYEDNFGALTPMIAEVLKADMETYPAEWIEDAMKEAVNYKARNWKYVQAILRNWQEKGRKKTDEEGKQDLDKFRQYYLKQKSDQDGG